MKYFSFLTLMFLAFAVSLSIISSNPNFAVADESLDGKSFSIFMKEKGNEDKMTEDVLIFKDGTFFSTDCEQYGFSAAPYESKQKGDDIKFKSTLTSKKEGKAEWEGKVTGKVISGTFIWSKEGQDPITYIYKGKLKK